MKRIVIFLAVFLFTAQSAFAVSIKQIVSKPIFKPEVAVLSKLIKEHKHISIADFRNLLRNYVGNNAAVANRIKIKSRINALLETKGTYDKKNYIVVKSQYFLKNGKIVKEKIHKIYINTSFFYYGNIGNIPPSNLPMKINSWLIHRHKAGKVLAELVYHILRHYPNIYKNINAQGNHYQNALWIAADRGLFHTVFILMKDKNLRYNITGESIYFISTNYCRNSIDKGLLAFCNWRNSSRMGQYISSKITNFPYAVQDRILGGGYENNGIYGAGIAHFEFFAPTNAFEDYPFYALALHSEKNNFDTLTKERLFDKTLPALY